MGLPIGHGEQNEAIALGARARLDGDAGTLTFLEGAVA
jgi:muramoyltetrapeptide carboxypeptidase LdcA involved in peptidoglycan recycling